MSEGLIIPRGGNFPILEQSFGYRQVVRLGSVTCRATVLSPLRSLRGPCSAQISAKTSVLAGRYIGAVGCSGLLTPLPSSFV